jgi:hypothetical protein
VLAATLIAAAASVVGGRDAVASNGIDTIVVVETGDVGLYTSMQLDASGNPVIAHFDRGPNELRLVACGDSGCTANNIATSITDMSAYVSLDLDANGIPAIGVRVYSMQAYRLMIVRCDDVHCGNPTMTTTAFGGGQLSLELDSVGNPVVARVGINILHCDDPDCAGSGETATTPVNGYEPALELDAAGNPVVAFTSATGELGVLHCSDAFCNTASAVYPDAGTSIAEPSLALDGAGNPVVAYIDVLSSDLKILHCGDADCTSGNTINTIDTGYVSIASVAIDSNEHPAVAYYDTSSATALRLVRCGGPACSGGNVTRTIDNFGDVEESVVLGLDEFDNATVAYRREHSSYDNDLVVAHCATPVCDADDDGCADTMEGQSSAGAELVGGLRDSKNSYDYFNPTGDGMNRIDDVLAVVDQYYVDIGNPSYDADTDRTLLGPAAWDTGPPNGLQRVDDILNQLKQYFHDCA